MTCLPSFSRAFARFSFLLMLLALLSACSGEPAAPDNGAKPEPERQVLYWYDPMRPEVHFDAPGRSPFMDMDLVPMYADQVDSNGAGVAVAPEVQQTLGVRIGRVERDTVRPRLRATAKVRADQDSRWMLYSRAAGWIERLHVHNVGDPVRAGQILAEIYSPDLVQAQEEMLLSGATAPAAAERLRRLGIAEADIEAVRKAGQSRRRLPLRSPVSGSLADIRLHRDGRVQPDQPLLEIVARDSVWVEARLFPGQAGWLGEPIQARLRLPGRSGTQWHVEQGYLYPLADPVSQTQSLRFVLSESTGRLPPGIWLEAELTGAARENVLLVPAEAVIRTGDGDRVVTALPDNRFEPVEVRLGQRYGDRLEIMEGLAEGDSVVISGQFLLDSEAELRAGFRRLGSDGSGAGRTHDGHSAPNGDDDEHDTAPPAKPPEQAPAPEHAHGH